MNTKPDPIKLNKELEEYIARKTAGLLVNTHDSPDLPLRLEVIKLQWERNFWREKVLNP